LRCMIISSIVVDKVMYGVNAGKMALIVTNCAEQICRKIDAVCQRGTTIIGARGGYQGTQKQIVMCACSNKEMYQVQKIAKEVDAQAFLIVLESKEVYGEGFRTVQIGGEK
ncbi:MAG TPA: hypothetical protein DCL14_05900, partial [Ruminococcaceae bacterium]|nr:hypothetical protein [Oscillospiraceae bacterium]